MIKRILFFSNPYHLSVKNYQLQIINKNTDEIKQAAIEDIGFIVLDNQQITFTQAFIQELAANNTAVVFCDKKHHPSSMLFYLDTNTVQTELFAAQIKATEPLKKNLWKQIIEFKIKNQSEVLKKINKNVKPLLHLSMQVKSGDTTNREAVAAKYYWQNIFEVPNFKRQRYGMPPNPTLNYGYAILRAAVARAISGSGLLPTLGIHHHNKYNSYCLADDIMEPYRPYVDLCVYNIMKKNPDYHIIDIEQKKQLLNILNIDVEFTNLKRPLMTALSITTASLAKCFAGNQKKILYPLMK